MPLTFAFAKLSDPWSARQQRHLAAVSEFTTCVRHVSGKSNAVADALSRTTIAAVQALQPGIDYTALAVAQLEDEELPAYRTAISGLVLEDIPFSLTGKTLLCDISTGQPRPVVPAAWRRHIFDTVHGLAHPSVRATQTLIASKFVWHGLRKQVAHWARTCIPCQTSNTQQHVKAPLTTFKTPQCRFDHIHVDIVGPLRSSRGFTYLFTIVDRFTRWPVISAHYSDLESEQEIRFCKSMSEHTKLMLRTILHRFKMFLKKSSWLNIPCSGGSVNAMLG